MIEFTSKLSPIDNFLNYTNFDIQKSLHENIVNPVNASYFEDRNKEKLEVEIKKILKDNENKIISEQNIGCIMLELEKLFQKIATDNLKFPSIDIEDLIYSNYTTFQIESIRVENWKNHLLNISLPVIENALSDFFKLYNTEAEIKRII